MHLLAASALAGVECAHAVYVVPYGHVPAAGCYHHKGGRQAAVFVEFLGQFYMLVVVVNGASAILAVNALQLAYRDAFQIFPPERPVAA